MEVLEAGELRRFPLAPGRTRIGGLGCEVVLASAPAGEVHIWDGPPRALYTGGGAPPSMDGLPQDELPLADGLTLTWGAARITYRHPALETAGVLEELPEAQAPVARLAATSAATSAGASAGAPTAPVAPLGGLAPSAPPSRGGAGAERVSQRLRAGLLADQNLAAAPVLQKWREAVKQREFDADACAREVLAAATAREDDARLLERSGRLLRDLLMAPLMRGAKGASRKARAATRSGAAFLLSQVVAVGAYTLLLGLIFLLLRARWGWSPDGLLDGILETLGQLVPDPGE